MPQDELKARRVLPWLDAQDHYRAHRVLFVLALCLLAGQSIVAGLLVVLLISK